MRDAEPEDAAEVARVHVRAWQVGYRGLLPDEYLGGLRLEDRTRRYTFGDTRPDQPATIVAVLDGRILGFATTGPSRDEDVPGSGEVYAIYVSPQTWGRGIGGTLLIEARARLLARGFTEAVLWVLAGNERAQRCYRADGWHRDGHRREEDVGGVPTEVVRHRRRLD
ncbi:ribosomal protein S18 acetylase RimI-like enzyme [Saccharopolyspora lacisalsi]|uniref:Ribosomal protein S18 acetylase RimI-like enzyme n=1 Tax=Halosaccharopolyspora lacisalsi TaxID=1000566 RepID=A0A839DX33_9PSEU|nr:ribosomal protein S18 acetylase RimI-like enzyme [Halosaccharopolyspora lacisalsi]